MLIIIAASLLSCLTFASTAAQAAYKNPCKGFAQSTPNPAQRRISRELWYASHSSYAFGEYPQSVIFLWKGKCYSSRISNVYLEKGTNIVKGSNDLCVWIGDDVDSNAKDFDVTKLWYCALKKWTITASEKIASEGRIKFEANYWGDGTKATILDNRSE